MRVSSKTSSDRSLGWILGSLSEGVRYFVLSLIILKRKIWI